MDTSLGEICTVDLIKATELTSREQASGRLVKIDLDETAAAALLSNGIVQDSEGIKVAVVLKDAADWLLRLTGGIRAEDDSFAIGHAAEGLKRCVVFISGVV